MDKPQSDIDNSWGLAAALLIIVIAAVLVAAKLLGWA